ncbi:hypothetical protein HS125_07125 [bacterium]|nr:hypothetical protein [bacterium]
MRRFRLPTTTSPTAAQPAAQYVASSTAARPKMTQKDKTFIPHVLAIQQGTTVEFPNEDPFFHNVFSFSRGNDFDLGRYKQEGPAKTVVFGNLGVVDLYCDIHRTMRAYIVVVEHPFFTQPDAEGGSS